ncbi:MAG: RrF2 family transcriptional regulator [Planctomycetota bacterium]
MKLSAKAEYGCVALLELARANSTGQPVRIRSIAASQGIPERFLVQILLVLKSAGLVESTRGASGGYRLSREPAEITVLDVMEAVDGRSGPSRADSGAGGHPVGRALVGIWREAEAREREFLSGITLLDVLARIESPDDSTYQI